MRGFGFIQQTEYGLMRENTSRAKKRQMIPWISSSTNALLIDQHGLKSLNKMGGSQGE
jgi:hypothetical protein